MRVTIVGAGIVGLASAWSLTKRGHLVTLVEQAAVIPNPRSASGDEHRLMRHAYGERDGYAAMIPEALEAWQELWDDLGACHYDRCGLLGLSQRPGDPAEISRHGLERNGQSCEILQPGEAADRFPFLDREGFRYAFFSREGGVLLCRGIAHALLAWLGSHGAIICTDAEVCAIDERFGRVELASGASIDADLVLVAAGAWAPTLMPALSADLTSFTNLVAYLEPPRDLVPHWRKAPGILDIGGERDGYVVPPVREMRLKVACGSHKIAAGPLDFARAVGAFDPRRLLTAFSPPLARIDEYRILGTALCVYTFTSDQHFYCVRTGRVIALSACSGHGYKFGAAIGRRLASAVDDDGGDVAALAAWLDGRVRSQLRPGLA